MLSMYDFLLLFRLFLILGHSLLVLYFNDVAVNIMVITVVVVSPCVKKPCASHFAFPNVDSLLASVSHENGATNT